MPKRHAMVLKRNEIATRLLGMASLQIAWLFFGLWAALRLPKINNPMEHKGGLQNLKFYKFCLFLAYVKISDKIQNQNYLYIIHQRKEN